MKKSIPRNPHFGTCALRERNYLKSCDLVVQHQSKGFFETQSGKQTDCSSTVFPLMIYPNYQEQGLIEKWDGGHSWNRQRASSLSSQSTYRSYKIINGYQRLK